MFVASLSGVHSASVTGMPGSTDRAGLDSRPGLIEPAERHFAGWPSNRPAR